MLSTHTDTLPPEHKRRVHDDFRANEQAYLRMRDALLEQYRGQWVAVHGGHVIAASPDLVQITDQAARCAGHPYIANVGQEESVVFRVRRATFNYDRTYRPFALPRVSVTFWNQPRTDSRPFADVIPDVGSDLSVRPEGDCAAFDLFSSPYFTGLSGGVEGATSPTLIYRGHAEVNSRTVPAFIEPMSQGRERLIGRDVLNHHRVVFDGPAERVVFEP
jgi:hypothetical protein